MNKRKKRKKKPPMGRGLDRLLPHLKPVPVVKKFDVDEFNYLHQYVHEQFGYVESTLQNAKSAIGAALVQYKRKFDDSPKASMEEMTAAANRISDALHAGVQRRLKKQDEAFVAHLKRRTKTRRG